MSTVEEHLDLLIEYKRKEHGKIIKEIMSNITETAAGTTELALCTNDVGELLKRSVNDLYPEGNITVRLGSPEDFQTISQHFKKSLNPRSVFTFGSQPTAYEVYIWFVPKGYSKANASLTMYYWIQPDITPK
jgi:hypothetical protein